MPAINVVDNCLGVSGGVDELSQSFPTADYYSMIQAG